MKKLLKAFSLFVLFISTALFVNILSWNPSVIPVKSYPPAAMAFSDSFADFPLNETQFIDFLPDEESFNRLTKREKEEQLRDWLIYTIVSDESFSADEINQSLYDFFPLRYGYMKPISNFEYGKTRSLYIGNGEVVALLPKGISENERIDDLAHIADKHRMNLGKIPASIEVFEYEMNLDQEYALLTRTKKINVTNIFKNKEYGYHEATIRKLDDLERFMTQVDDITFAEVKSSNLVVGGRKIKGHNYRGIKVEDIATIWQSEKKIQENPNKYRVNGSGFSLDPNYDYEALKKELTKSENLLKSLTVNGKYLFSDLEIEQIKDALSKQDIDPYFILIKKLEQFIEKQIAENPEIEQLIKIGEQILIQNPEFVQIAQQCEQKIAENPELAEEIALQCGQQLFQENPEIIQLFVQLFQENPEIIQLFEQNPEFVEQFTVQSSIISQILSSFYFLGFQSARYDGELQGTEVGMNLFYTDLLAKIWSINYANSTPGKQINGFESETQIKVSSIYKQEIKELSSTRTWFEPNEKGFQVANGGNSLIFAHNTTKVSAKSSNQFKPDEEFAPTAIADIFVNWWNSHYEEVARYEPEYERLNEIMKWSLVISWLNSSNQGDILNFLQGIRIKNDYWFPDWAKANKNLTFKQWSKQPCSEQVKFESQEPICFYKRGYKGTTTETMPLLQSKFFEKFGEVNLLIGGVSLPDKWLFQKLTPLSPNTRIKEIIRRANLDYGKSVDLDANNFELKTLEGTTYQVKKATPNSSSTTAKAKEGTKLRSAEAELKNVQLTQNVSRKNNRLEINIEAENKNVGDFSTRKTGNGFTVGWQSRDIDQGQSLAFELSASGVNPEEFLRNHPMVESVIQVNDESVYYVKTNNSESWLELAEGDGGNANIPPDWTSRVGSPDNPNNSSGRGDNENNQDYLLSWVDGEQKGQQLVDERQAAYIVDKSRKKQDFDAKLEDIDTLIESNLNNKALLEINRLININGEQPDLMVRKAVVQIKRGRLNIQEVNFKDDSIPPNKSKPNFLDEVNQQILNREKKFRGVKFDDAFIYIQDHPGFNNIDLSQPLEASLPFIPSNTRVFQLQFGEIGEMKLGEFGLELSNISDNAEIIGGGFRLRENSQKEFREAQEECKEGQEECKAGQDRIYIIYVDEEELDERG